MARGPPTHSTVLSSRARMGCCPALIHPANQSAGLISINHEESENLTGTCHVSIYAHSNQCHSRTMNPITHLTAKTMLCTDADKRYTGQGGLLVRVPVSCSPRLGTAGGLGTAGALDPNRCCRRQRWTCKEEFVKVAIRTKSQWTTSNFIFKTYCVPA